MSRVEDRYTDIYYGKNSLAARIWLRHYFYKRIIVDMDISNGLNKKWHLRSYKIFLLRLAGDSLAKIGRRYKIGGGRVSQILSTELRRMMRISNRAQRDHSTKMTRKLYE